LSVRLSSLSTLLGLERRSSPRTNARAEIDEDFTERTFYSHTEVEFHLPLQFATTLGLNRRVFGG